MKQAMSKAFNANVVQKQNKQQDRMLQKIMKEAQEKIAQETSEEEPVETLVDASRDESLVVVDGHPVSGKTVNAAVVDEGDCVTD